MTSPIVSPRPPAKNGAAKPPPCQDMPQRKKRSATQRTDFCVGGALSENYSENLSPSLCGQRTVVIHRDKFDFGTATSLTRYNTTENSRIKEWTAHIAPLFVEDNIDLSPTRLPAPGIRIDQADPAPNLYWGNPDNLLYECAEAGAATYNEPRRTFYISLTSSF